MSLSPGTRLQHYEVLAPIGRGGMGEVYRARDERLGRSVAIKVLPERFRGDAELRARLELEARAISQLSHPNICTLYDVGHEGDIDFLVMELLDGETLFDRLGQGPIPVEEALPLAATLARALDRAHKSGIIHRDLKPGNVMLTADGPKILDFGLAKDVQPFGVPADSESPTALVTGEGMIVGTLHYMSPEQLAGKSVDVRTDVFAFGCVVHEMLTNERAFGGDNQASVIAAILEREPGARDAVPGLSSPMDDVIARCLAKDPEKRWQSLGDVALLLERPIAGESPSPVTTESPARRAPWLSVAVVGLVAAVAGMLLGRGAKAPPVEDTSPPTHVVLERSLLDGFRQISNPAISHDGRTVAFISATAETSGLYLRRVDELEPRHVENTENAGWVTFSHDDQWLAYFDGVSRTIRKISIHGGSSEVLADPGYLPFDWREDGTLYYPARRRSRENPTSVGLGLTKLGPGDDVPQVVTKTELGDLGRLEIHASPTLLPGGRHLLMSRGDGFLQTRWKTGVLALETGEWRTLSENTNQTQFADGFWILWRSSQLWAAALDEDFEVVRPPRPVLDGVGQHPRAPLEIGQFDVGSDGSLVYIRAGATTSESISLVLARAGGPEEREEILRVTDHETNELVPSPRRRLVAARRCSTDDRNVRRFDNCSIWLREATAGEGVEWVELSPAGGRYGYPVWHPSGEALVFSSIPGAGERPVLVRQRLEGGAAETLMEGEPDERLMVTAATRAGDILLNAFDRQQSKARVLLVRRDGEVEHLFDARGGELATDVSSDGRWLLMGGGLGAVLQVLVLDLETSGAEPRQLTSDGGWYPIFSADEESIYYRGSSYPGSSQIFQAAVDLDSQRLGAPVVLVETASVNTPNWRQAGYLSADPEGVLFTLPQASSTGGELVLVQNWLDTLPKLLEPN